MGTMVVTGASDGIGAAAAVMLTQLGHEVLGIGRSQEKLDRVHERMVDAAPEGVSVPVPIALDLSSMAEVRRLAGMVLERCPQLDVLANNVGLQLRKRESSPDGYEMVFAVNHLAPFLLTNLVLERLQESGGRVVGTSSVAHRFARIDFDDLQQKRKWNRVRSYGGSKLANIWFTSELTRRTGLPASCYHPGAVDTGFYRSSKLEWAFRPMSRRLFRSSEDGAGTLVWLATDPEGGAPHAVYYKNCAPAKMSARAHDQAAAARLWDVSAELVGL
jgi:NAD(P)-dependent dehydrogenase (short-subunit alcohol dehydrogenase family)